ncbi:MAG: methyltransferase [Bacteroidota bacterium]
MTNSFRFKQFSINQDRCAMKIGTDGVLLGAWATIDHRPETVLDIGSGTGVLSLMIAQRTNHAYIEAIEIDAEAYVQCTENFEASPWADRLFCYHASLIEFVEEVDERFDLIICNPPFYDGSYKTDEASRNMARFQDAMPFEHLIYAVQNLLADKGIFAVIIPSKEEATFIEIARNAGLFLSRKCGVKGSTKSLEKRALLELTKTENIPVSEMLIIETDRHLYTTEYKALVQDFYLKM